MRGDVAAVNRMSARWVFGRVGSAGAVAGRPSSNSYACYKQRPSVHPTVFIPLITWEPSGWEGKGGESLSERDIRERTAHPRSKLVIQQMVDAAVTIILQRIYLRNEAVAVSNFHCTEMHLLHPMNTRCVCVCVCVYVCVVLHPSYLDRPKLGSPLPRRRLTSEVPSVARGARSLSPGR
jgi:hypothetical protein